MQIKFFKVTELPATLIADAIYAVGSANYVEMYITSSTGEAKLAYSSSTVTDAINAALAQQNALQIVETIAERDAYFTGTVNKLCLVNDATDDLSVDNGAALYSYKGADSVVTKLTEYESLDVTLMWDAIQNKPTSAVADIDDAVTKRHVHANKSVIDELGVDSNDYLTYKGNAVRPVWSTLSW